MDIDLLNIEEFDRRTKDQWKNEEKEFFSCLKCQAIFLGVPDCHVAFYDGRDVKRKVSYNTSSIFKCPVCKALLHDPRDISRQAIKSDLEFAELEQSSWHWLLKDESK